MNTFDEILTSILKTVEENPAVNIDELLAAKLTELGISEEGKKTFQETNSYLEAYDEMYAKLQAAKDEDEYLTRNEWLQNELLAIADKHQLTDEQKEQLISDIATQCEDSLKSTIEGGE